MGSLIDMHDLIITSYARIRLLTISAFLGHEIIRLFYQLILLIKLPKNILYDYDLLEVEFLFTSFM